MNYDEYFKINDEYLKKMDVDLENISLIVGQTKDIAVSISHTLDTHTEKINELDSKTDHIQTKLDSSNSKLNKIFRELQSKKIYYVCSFFMIVILIILIIFLYKFYQQ